jgi:hypothetical protein
MGLLMISDREYFLLKNADEGNDCKQYYREYIDLQSEGLIYWQIGHAWLTFEGKQAMKEYKDSDENT